MACHPVRGQRAGHGRGQHHPGVANCKFIKIILKINTVFFGKHVTSLYFDTFGGCWTSTLTWYPHRWPKRQLFNGFPIDGKKKIFELIFNQ